MLVHRSILNKRKKEKKEKKKKEEKIRLSRCFYIHIHTFIVCRERRERERGRRWKSFKDLEVEGVEIWTGNTMMWEWGIFTQIHVFVDVCICMYMAPWPPPPLLFRFSLSSSMANQDEFTPFRRLPRLLCRFLIYRTYIRVGGIWWERRHVDAKRKERDAVMDS